MRDEVIGHNMFGSPIIRNKSEFEGVPLKVLAIDIPYIIVEATTVLKQVIRFNLDTRQFRFMLLSEEYVNAFLQKEEKI